MIRHDHPVNETRACGLQIKGGAAGGPEFRRDSAGGGAKKGVGSYGGDEDEIEIGWGEFCLSQCLFGSGHSHEGGSFGFGGDAALFNSCSCQDPLIGCFDQFFQFVIRDNTAWEIDAGSGNLHAGFRLGRHPLGIPYGLRLFPQRE